MINLAVQRQYFFLKELSCGSSTLTDPTSIANIFNEFFTDIGPNLAEKNSLHIWFSFGLYEQEAQLMLTNPRDALRG